MPKIFFGGRVWTLNTDGSAYYDNGNVGVGTSLPMTQLHLNGINNGKKQILQTYLSTIGAYSGLTFKVSGNSGDTYQKAGIFFERLTTNGRGELHLAMNDEANDNNALPTDKMLTITGSHIKIHGGLKIKEKSTDPIDPAEGEAILWLSNGTDTGEDGDLLVKITAGGTTKTATLIDFSTI